MKITPDTLARIALRPANDNMRSTIRGLAMRPTQICQPHRLYHFLGQAAHESGAWRYDRELWGPTPAQSRYEWRIDLGNIDRGDGYLYRGRAGFEITGHANYADFTVWARANYPGSPDFVTSPDLINSDPWEGLASIWYWESHGLNSLADAGDIEAVTRRINGGVNGIADRIKYTIAAGVILGGYPDIKAFQKLHGLTVDGIAGPITLGKLHAVLQHCPPVLFALT